MVIARAGRTLRTAICHCQLLQWVEQNSGTGITETDAAEMLENFYKNQPGFKVRNFFKLEKVSFNFQGLSFETIASTGSNTAIAHYAPEKGSDQFLNYSVFLGKSPGVHRIFSQKRFSEIIYR